MDKNENMTALMSAFARAYHTEHNEITMYSDPLAHRILGEEDYTAIARNIVGGIKFFEPNFSGTDDEALRAAVEKRLAPGVTARSFFAERALRTEVSLRTKQYIILGAGLDTFAYRRPEWAKDLEIFDVDMPKMCCRTCRYESYSTTICPSRFISRTMQTARHWRNTMQGPGARVSAL